MNDLMIIKEKIRQLELGSSGSTLGSDPSTAVGTGPSGLLWILLCPSALDPTFSQEESSYLTVCTLHVRTV